MSIFKKGAGQSRLILSVGLATLVLVLGIISYDRQVGTVSAGTEHNMSGWAWSDNIGWISFNSLNKPEGIDYGVNVAGDVSGALANNALSGYAWNENVGWIKFSPGGTDPLNGAGLASVVNNQMTGWARSCTVFIAGCSGALKPDYQLGGWDGWISLSGPGYGITYLPASKTFGTYGNNANTFAWGDTNIGWVNFQPRQCAPGEDPSLCGVILGIPELDISSCTIQSDGNTSPVHSTWTVSARGGTGNYMYAWQPTESNAVCSPDFPSGYSSINRTANTTCNSQGSSAGTVTAQISVKDGSKNVDGSDKVVTKACGTGITINQPAAGYSLSANPATVAALFQGNLIATTSPVSIVSVVPFGPPNPPLLDPKIDLSKSIDPQVLAGLGLTQSDVVFQFSYTLTGNPTTWPIETDNITSNGKTLPGGGGQNKDYDKVSLQIFLKKKPTKNGNFQVQVRSDDGMTATLTVSVDKGTSGIQEQ